jgi:hypothetical protein
VVEFEELASRKKQRIDGSNFVGRIEIVENQNLCFFFSKMKDIEKRRKKQNLSLSK